MARMKPLPPPTAEFLAELAERAKRSGWEHDYTEIRSFVWSMYEEAEIRPPSLEPYNKYCAKCDEKEFNCTCEEQELKEL